MHLEQEENNLGNTSTEGTERDYVEVCFLAVCFGVG